MKEIERQNKINQELFNDVLKEHEELIRMENKEKQLEEKNKKKEEKNWENIGGSDLINKSITKLMNAVNDHIKEQNNDNQSILNKLMKEKELEFKNDQKLIQKLSEIRNKNKELEAKLHQTNYIIETTEEQIKKLLPYQDLINNISNFKCDLCNKFFTFTEFKIHKSN